ncbi:MAG: trypsin-like peptidase domain-containing protein [Desulfosarcinaceae bacterium]
MAPSLPRNRSIALLGIVLVLILLAAGHSAARIYKYQKNGVWHYTDTPPEDLPAGSEEMAESGRPAPAPASGGTPLLADYPAKNDIEKAAAATVAVQSPMGFGSGFFISADGYLITNKHVIRATESQDEKNEAFFSNVEERIATAESQLADEKRRIDAFRERLEKYKHEAETQAGAGMKKSYLENYAAKRKELEAWEADHKARAARFEAEKKRFRSQRSSYDYTRTVAGLARSFTIFLADDTQLYVRLVTVSERQDLALLKLDGYRVPCLKPARAAGLAQGDPVYAIGNPIKLKNSVTSGIFSGFEQGFIQTNAQIYPGNSGGPLITAGGEVLGVNTFKKLTRKFEGLGFAIPIHTALSEFSEYLGAPGNRH